MAEASGGVPPEAVVSPMQAQLYNHHLAHLYDQCRMPLTCEMRSMQLDSMNQAWLAHRAGMGRARMMGQRA